MSSVCDGHSTIEQNHRIEDTSTALPSGVHSLLVVTPSDDRIMGISQKHRDGDLRGRGRSLLGEYCSQSKDGVCHSPMPPFCVIFIEFFRFRIINYQVAHISFSWKTCNWHAATM